MKTKFEKTNSSQFTVNQLFLLSILIFGGILISTGMFLGNRSNPAKSNKSVFPKNNFTPAIVTPTFIEKTDHVREDIPEYAESILADLSFYTIQDLEQDKLDNFAVKNNNDVNRQLQLEEANQFEENDHYSNVKPIASKSSPSIVSFTLKENEYLHQLLEQKNSKIFAKIELDWKLRNLLKTENESPLTLEYWMIDENCWCPKNINYDNQSFHLLTYSSK